MEPEVEIVLATTDLAWQLAHHVREPDAAEVEASTGHTPLEALVESVRLSAVAKAALVDGQPMALFGFVDLSRQWGPGWAGVWAITGTLVDEHPAAFQAATVRELAAALERWPTLTNFVDCRYRRSIRWLERMGAIFLEPQPFGVAQLPFAQFILTRSNFKEA